MTRLGSGARISDALRGGIIALGNFDGFHAGHQQVAAEAIRWARSEGRVAIIATFDPHPVRFFKPDVPPFRLTTLDQRERLFTEAGADAMLVFDFNAELAGTTAEDFIDTLLIDRFGAAGVVTGEDFTFGKARGGSVAMLADYGTAQGLKSRAVGAVADSGAIISSSLVRDALREGDCAAVTKLLTRPFTIQGTVQHGDKRGRTIGYPTANIDMDAYLRPRYGIYAVTGHLPDGRVLKGAANLGIRPTFDPPKELLEPYFFDFDEDLYGQEIEVALHHFLRPEAKFDDMDALVTQMNADCARAKELLT
ncbi:bifunctional riboflavin kinase/FAD synthetase [Sphingorhabdus sp. Alg239-R122]|uniref:bifunctional riboflavin kinase/FAD synthetase n=1 Tax=Sphingorhabdus sp. Alg239-R122 TaxID=2305989 RepID=UPI0013DD5320|nr:bifunctional riboflavin kinase/FAD synthetase [Sphingorhabdus sp. Alg239-R122]